MSGWAIFILVTATRKEAVETSKTIEAVETARVNEYNENGKDDKYLRNLVQILCIWYPIIF